MFCYLLRSQELCIAAIPLILPSSCVILGSSYFMFSWKRFTGGAAERAGIVKDDVIIKVSNQLFNFC